MSHIQAPVNLNNNQITSNVVTDPEIQTTVNLIHSKIVGKVTIDNKQIKTIVTEARDAWQIARDLFVADGGDPEDFMSREDWIESLSSNVDIDTDGALTANSDVKISSQKATKTYVDTFYDTIVVVLNGKLSRSANLGDLANPNIAIAQLGAVPNSRRVNGIALTSDITVNAAAETLTGSAININITDAPGLISVAGGTFGTAAFTDASLFESPLNFSNGIRRIGDQVELYSPEVRGPGGDFGSAAYTESSSYEAPLSFSSGLLRTGNNIEVDQSGITGAVGGEFGSAAYTSVDSLALLNGTNSFTGTSSFNGVLFSTLVEYNSGIVFSYFGDSAANHRAALDVPSISDVTAVQDGINQEILDRGSADSGLAANIYQEINDRIAAINTVADSVGYESDQRVSAIGSLQSALDSEVSRAIAAEAGLQSEINAKIPLVSFTGPVSEIRSFILPDYNATLAISDASQTFYGDQTFGNNVAVNGSLTVGGLSVATLVSPEKTTLTGNGVTTVFAIAGAGSLTNPSALVVAIDGVLQEPIVDYSVGGGNITFTLPVPNGSKAVVVSPTNTIQIGDVIPSDGSVTSEKLAANIAVAGTLTANGQLAIGSMAANDVMTKGLSDTRYSPKTVTSLPAPDYSSASGANNCWIQERWVIPAQTNGLYTGGNTYGMAYYRGFFTIGAATGVGKSLQIAPAPALVNLAGVIIDPAGIASGSFVMNVGAGAVDLLANTISSRLRLSGSGAASQRFRYRFSANFAAAAGAVIVMSPSGHTFVVDTTVTDATTWASASVGGVTVRSITGGGTPTTGDTSLTVNGGAPIATTYVVNSATNSGSFPACCLFCSTTGVHVVSSPFTPNAHYEIYVTI